VTTVLVVANRRTQLSADQLNLLVRDMHRPLINALHTADADELARLLQRQFENTDYLRQVRPDVATLTPQLRAPTP
jgi:hypothetical protein